MTTTTENRIKYSVGTNFDPEVIHEIHHRNGNGEFKSVFGKFRSDLFGGGRPASVLPNLNFKYLRYYTDLCHQYGIKFDYLINSMCTGNKDVIPRTHRKMLDFINRLVDHGVDCLTVSSPYLCTIVKTRFPKIKITVGLFALVTTVQQLKYWWEMGADEVTVFNIVNRNFQLIENMLEYTKNKNLSVRVIANNICLHACPYTASHATSISHASQKGNSTSKIHLDSNWSMCTYNKLSNPAQLIASEWIRPDDVPVYESICAKTDNYNFCIKLLDRTKKTPFLKRVINAYADRKFDGNLFDILAFPSVKDTVTFHKLPMIVQAFIDRYRMKEIKKVNNFFQFPTMHIDNRMLDGFIDFFAKSKIYTCDRNVCSDNEETLKCSDKNGSGTCNYCSTWAKKALKFDPKDMERWLAISTDLIESFNKSKFFGCTLND